MSVSHISLLLLLGPMTHVDFRDRQGVSVRAQMHVQPFNEPDVICKSIYASIVTRKC